MKKFKKFFIWAAFGISIELTGLWYMDKFMFLDTIPFEIVEVKEEIEPFKAKKKLIIPKEIEEFGVSNNGKYLSYCQGNYINIINTQNGDKEEVHLKEGEYINKYTWLKDKNRILIGEKIKENTSSKFKLSYYDVEKDIKDDITHLSWESNDWNITDITVSSLTDIIYVKITNGKNSKIYSIDLAKNLWELNTNTKYIGNIQASEKEEKLIYEDLESNKLIYHINNVNKDILKLQDLRLLYVDKEDNIYFYRMKNGKVCDIVYTKDTNYNKLNYINLEKSCYVEDIHVSSQGIIYVNDKKDKIVKNLTNNKQIRYFGKFIGFYEEGFIYLKDNLYVINKQKL